MTHYELLEIDQHADESAIKRAWASKVRQYPPDKDPEMNQRINEARATLLDAVARADYDAELSFGDDIEDLQQDMTDAFLHQDYEAAIAFGKEILALNPKSLATRDFISLAYCHLGEYQAAAMQMQRIMQDAPTSALYASHIGAVYQEWGEQSGEPARLDEAEVWFRRAIALEPFNATYYTRLAQLLASRDRFEEAESEIENAVAADGKFDIDDIDALMHLTWIFMLSGQIGRTEEVADRILTVLPDDEEARDYASFKFIQNAAMLASHHKRFQEAEALLNVAKRIQTHFGEHHEAVESMLLMAKAERECILMLDDEVIQPKLVVGMLSSVVRRKLGLEVPPGLMDKIAYAIAQVPNDEVRRAISACQARYPNACKYIADDIHVMQGFGTPEGSQRQTGGCMTIPVAVVLISLLGLLTLAI